MGFNSAFKGLNLSESYFFPVAEQPQSGLDRLIVQFSRQQHSIRYTHPVGSS